MFYVLWVMVMAVGGCDEKYLYIIIKFITNIKVNHKRDKILCFQVVLTDSLLLNNAQSPTRTIYLDGQDSAV